MNSCNKDKPVLRLPRQKQSETVTHYYLMPKGFLIKPEWLDDDMKGYQIMTEDELLKALKEKYNV